MLAVTLREQSPPIETLFREHYHQVFRVAYRITGNALDAEDVLQTVFLRLSRKEELDLSPSPAAYLSRAAINASLDLVKSRWRTVSIDALDNYQSAQASPEVQHRDRELQAIVRKAIAALGTKTAELIVLKYFEGYSNKEIARMLGTSEIVIAVMLHRGRARIRKELGKFLED